MKNTKIQWTDSTWNPVRGCSRISPGCMNCYAERQAARFAGPGQPFHLFADRSKSGSKWTGQVGLVESKLDEPLLYRGKPRVFVNSMSDLFHEKLTDAEIDRVFWTMVKAPRCTFQVLTKRAHRLADWFLRKRGHFIREVYRDGVAFTASALLPFENIWLGVSVENQDAHDERVPYLRSVPAVVRFLSVEPLLGPVKLDLRGIGWVIVGGESSPGARPMHPKWVRSIRFQCLNAGVPFFFKQWGEWEIASHSNGHFCSDMARNGAMWVDVDGTVAGPSSHGLLNPYAMIRVGKKKAGRLLDGVEHSEFPG